MSAGGVLSRRALNSGLNAKLPIGLDLNVAFVSEAVTRIKANGCSPLSRVQLLNLA
jgi:hypothetical protein